MSAKMIRTETHSIRTTIDGRGSPDWVCLHGLADRLEIWDHLTPKLAERGRVICMDQRGHGGSGAPAGPYDRKDLAKDVIAVLDAFESERALLLGHSMGGVVSMVTALEYPERVEGLVLIGTASQCSEKAASWYGKIANSGEEGGIDGLRRTIYGAKSRKEIVADAQGMAAVTRTLASLHTEPLTPLLSAIDCPVLLIVGKDDPMGPKASSIIAEVLPQADLVEVEGCGHWVQKEAPACVLDAVDRWRSGSSPGPR